MTGKERHERKMEKKNRHLKRRCGRIKKVLDKFEVDYKKESQFDSVSKYHRHLMKRLKVLNEVMKEQNKKEKENDSQSTNE